jgi:hypothetical protein
MVIPRVDDGGGGTDLILSEDEQEELYRRALTIPGANNEVALPIWYEAAVEALRECDECDMAAKFMDMSERA